MSITSVIKNLKTLFQNWCYPRDSDETNYTTWLNNNTSHSNGVLTTNVKHIQTVTLSLSVFHDYPGYFMGSVKCTVSPPVEGQEILINNAYIGGTIRTNKNGQATSRDGRLNKNSTVTVTVQPMDKADHSYLGCTGTIKVTY